MSKHTPGPWEARGYYDEDYVTTVDGPDNFRVARTDTIARKRETKEANARLIAAAPRMLACVERFAVLGDEEAQLIMESINASS